MDHPRKVIEDTSKKIDWGVWGYQFCYCKINLFAEVLLEELKNSGHFRFNPSKMLGSGDMAVKFIPI